MRREGLHVEIVSLAKETRSELETRLTSKVILRLRLAQLDRLESRISLQFLIALHLSKFLR